MSNKYFKREMLGTLALIVGVGTARAMPIILGVIFARTFEPNIYSTYVLFVVAANLVASIPMMGNSLLILSARNSLIEEGMVHRAVHMTLIVQGFSYLVMFGFGEWNRLSAGNADEISQISMLLALYPFSLGYAMTGMAVAFWNKMGMRFCASACWTFTSILSLLCCSGVVLYGGTATSAIVALSGGWLVGGAACVYILIRFVRASNVDSSLVAALHPRTNAWEWTRQVMQVVLLGVPSIIFLLGFYLLLQQVKADNDEILGAEFSLGYQIFSIVLFVPGVLGNVVTPRLVELQKNLLAERKLIKKVLLIYIGYAGVVIALVTLYLPWLMSIFNIPNSATGRWMILTLQAAAFGAAIQALMNQWMAASRLFNYILGTALVWLLCLLFLMHRVGAAADVAAQAIALSYFMSLIFCVFVYAVKGSSQRVNHAAD
jgi:hypothetical protein